MTACALQIQDDPELLDLIISDEANAPEIYRPTNYWRSPNEERLLPELRRLGLNDFRRRRGSVLCSFGATDLWPMPNVGTWPVIHRLPKAIRKGITSAVFDTSWFKRRKQRILATYVEIAHRYGKKKGALLLEKFNASIAGNPEDHCFLGDNCYTTNHLNYYMQYAYCCQFIAFEQIGLIAELGPGSGKQVEVIKKLHPHITFLLFDLGPQLYVCEQYLKSVFPNEVISYIETRELEQISVVEKGKIYMFGAYKFPFLSGIKADLFWNSASFQEMEPSIVENYLGYVRETASNVYLRQRFGGHSEGEKSVLKKVTFMHYIKCLHSLEMADISRTECVGYSDLVYNDYYDAFWQKL